jgi:hypothetical protein
MFVTANISRFNSFWLYPHLYILKTLVLAVPPCSACMTKRIWKVLTKMSVKFYKHNLNWRCCSRLYYFQGGEPDDGMQRWSSEHRCHPYISYFQGLLSFVIPSSWIRRSKEVTYCSIVASPLSWTTSFLKCHSIKVAFFISISYI